MTLAVQQLNAPPAVAAAQLKGRLIARADLSAQQVHSMEALLADHFEGVSREVFRRDLQEKDWVVVLEDAAAGELRGFSTFHMYQAADAAGGPIAVVYSGDTIVHRCAWGTPTLPRAWIHSVYQVHQAHFAHLPLWWLLLTSGFRTYRFLPVFWREFWPRFDVPTPPEFQKLLNQLAGDRFNRAFDPARGVVSLPCPQILRGDLLDVPPERRDDPHVAFFLDKNPLYTHGDELVCLANLAPTNLTPAGRRMVYGTASPSPIGRGQG